MHAARDPAILTGAVQKLSTLLLILASSTPASAQPDGDTASGPGDEQLAWARSVLPGLADVTTRPVVPDLTPLGPPGTVLTLFVPGELLPDVPGTRAARCRTLKATVLDGSLRGEVRLSKKGRFETFAEVRAGDEVRVYGPHVRDTGRKAAGPDSQTVIESPFVREDGAMLQLVAKDRLEYGLTPARAEARCARRHEQVCNLEDGTTGVCARCDGLGLFLRSLRSGRGLGFRSAWRKVDAKGSARPHCSRCPTDALEFVKARLAEVLRDRVFFGRSKAPWPVLFLRRVDCERAVDARTERLGGAATPPR